MKLKINYISNCYSKHNKQNDINSSIFNNNLLNNKKNKIFYFRNDLSKEKYILWKRYNSINSINENINIKQYINSNNTNNSIIETNNINDKLKKNKQIHLIEKNKIKNYDKFRNISPVQKSNYNLKKIHDIISFIQKKLNLFNNGNNNNSNCYSSHKNNNKKTSLIIKRNNKRKLSFNKSNTIYKYNKISLSLANKENYNLNNIENKKRNSIDIMGELGNKINKNDLIPFPYKRMQKKLRKYFSFSKRIKLTEDQFSLNRYSKQFQLQNDIINDNNKYNIIIKNNNFKYINNKNNKIIKNNTKKYKKKDINNNYKYTQNNSEIKIKEDKSVNTKSTLLRKYINSIKNNKNKIEIENEQIPLFNNELIASKTNPKDSNIFITTKILEENGKRKIIVYHKNF